MAPLARAAKNASIFRAATLAIINSSGIAMPRKGSEPSSFLPSQAIVKGKCPIMTDVGATPAYSTPSSSRIW